MTAVLQDDPADPCALNPRCRRRRRRSCGAASRRTGGTLPVRARPGLRISSSCAIRPARRARRAAAVRPSPGARGADGGRARSPRRPSFGVLLLRPPAARPHSSSSPFAAGASAARGSLSGQAVVYSEAREGHPLEVWRIHLADSPASRSARLSRGRRRPRDARRRARPVHAASCWASASSARWPWRPLAAERPARSRTTSKTPTGTLGRRAGGRPIDRRAAAEPDRISRRHGAVQDSRAPSDFCAFSPTASASRSSRTAAAAACRGGSSWSRSEGAVTAHGELGQRARPGVVARR